jgi:SSS family solute:Na+ symporter
MHAIDYVIIGAYFIVVLLVGAWLKNRIRTSEDYFISGRSLSAWITGISYVAANLGSLELMGFVANGAKYGMFTNQLYWLGSIPAMIFAGLVMTPFFYRNKVKSVPEYLYRRYDGKTRTLNAVGFAILTVLTSGINLYGLALVFKVLFNWPIDASIFIAAGTVLIYVTWGGLTASIFNEVLQFVLIVVGLFPLSIYALSAVGGLKGLRARLPEMMVHTWKPVLHPSGTPYGGGLFSVVVGMGFVVSFAYWSTDFLVMQRTLAARDLESAQKTPLIAAFAKALFPFLTVVPGLAALLILPNQIKGNFNLTLPLMLVHFYPAGLLGLGLTALVASFMSGMAGNVTAFNTVWTYDLYQTYIAPARSDRHYLFVGRVTTVGGIAISIFTAYLALHFENMFDYWALLSSIFIGTGFATFFLGIFSKRITGTGAFCGMLTGFAVAIANYVLYEHGVVHYGSLMEMDFLGGTWGFIGNAVMAWTVSLGGKPKRDAELAGLVHSLRPVIVETSTSPWYGRPIFLAVLVASLTIVLNIIFW